MGLGWDSVVMNSTAPTYISIRPAHRDDFVELWRVASLDSASVPAEPLLVAESDGRLVAALSLDSGDAIADPFLRTVPALDLLRLRASQLPSTAAEHPHRSVLSRLLGRSAPVPAQ